MKNFKTPPFLLSYAILFWGWQTGFIFLAVCLAAVLEGSLLVSEKWDFSEADFNHVTDLCVLIFVTIYVYSAIDDTRTAVYHVMKLLPCIGFPLIAAQRYSVKECIPLRSLFTIVRKSEQIKQLDKLFDVSYPYFLLCIIAAGAANVKDGAYSIGILVLGAWGAFSLRTRRFAIWQWGLLVILGFSLSVAGHIGLFNLQEKITELSRRYFSGIQDPYRSNTSIGEIGAQKMHNYIVFRAEVDASERLPLLLREASYNVYEETSWVAVKSPMKNVAPHREFSDRIISSNDDWERWVFDTEVSEHDSRTLTVKQDLKYGMGMLKLPLGTYEVDRLDAELLKKNRLGAVMITEGADYVSYKVKYNPYSGLHHEPNEQDLKVPELEQPALRKIIDQLQLEGLGAREIVERVEAYFDNNYGYTLNRTDWDGYESPLAYFLLDRKAGHCELFATATVLLLRECGVPARYAVGYAAEERSFFTDDVVIRHRHGHAWTLVYVEGQWENLDTTSANWMDIEEQMFSAFSYFGDFFSFIGSQLSEINWTDQRFLTALATVLIVILAILMARRLKSKKKTRKVKVAKSRATLTISRQGIESAFYLLEEQIEDNGYKRYIGEPLRDWSRRVEKAAPDLLDFAQLNSLIEVHYSLRFRDSVPDKQTFNEIARQVDTLISSLSARV